MGSPTPDAERGYGSASAGLLVGLRHALGRLLTIVRPLPHGASRHPTAFFSIWSTVRF